MGRPLLVERLPRERVGRSLYSEARAMRAMDWEKEEMEASSVAWGRRGVRVEEEDEWVWVASLTRLLRSDMRPERDMLAGD